MSVILMASRKRDLSCRKKSIRKAGELDEKGRAQITMGWQCELDGCTHRIQFSRDNMTVYIDGSPCEATAYISDKGYDLDLYFNLGCNKFHIFSDVEKGREMTNHLIVNNCTVAKEFSKT